MNNRGVRISIAVAIGLATAALLLVAGRATADLPPSELLVAYPRAVRASEAWSWSSAWVPITGGHAITFEHNLGQDPEDCAVELLFLDTDGGLGINRRNYGGLEVGGHWFGAHWQDLTANTIQVYRQPHDDAADMVRIRVWVPPATPGYASEWMGIGQNQAITIEHNVGITPTDLVVGLWFSGTDRGIHHFAYGGLAVDGPQRMLGAHWQNLTTNTIQVYRHPHDTDVEQVHVIVNHGADPDYDSGWQDIPLGSTTAFTHGLSWDPNMLLARGECYDPSGLRGIHQLFDGGNHSWFGGGRFQGVSLETLTSDTVAATRANGDDFCPQIRIRIWKRSMQLYLPIALRSD